MGERSITRSKRTIGVVCMSVALVLSVIAGGVGIAAVGAQSDADVTEIDSCTTISEPGRYVLTADIEDSSERTCIVIGGSAENVTLDGDGHTIDGTGNGWAIVVGESTGGDATNVVITDVVVTDWGVGISYDGVSGGAIRNNVVTSNGFGIQLGFFTDDVEIRDNTIVDNRVGLWSVFSTDNVFENNVVSSEETDYFSEGDVVNEGELTSTVRDLRLDTATLSFEENIETGGLVLRAARSLPDDPEDRRNIGQYVNVGGSSTGNNSLAFGMHYTEADVEQAGVDEDSLRLYRFADGEWTELPASTVDTDANVVTMSIDNLSIFGTESVVAPLGEPADDGAANGEDGNDVTEIDSCAEISEPGRYVLTEDIENSNENACVRITATDIVFDGDGHTIDGVDQSGTEAVSVAGGGANFTVTNVAVTDWGVGVYVDASGEGIISHSTIESNGIGINLLSSDVTVAENTITDNQGFGIALETGVRFTITENTVSSNGAGILFDDEISQTVVSNNTVTENQGTGIAITDFSSGQLSDNVVTDNAIGIEVTDSTPVIEDTVASDNSEIDYLTESELEPSFTGDVTNFEIDSARLSFEAKNLGLVAVDAPPTSPAGLTNAGGYVEVANGEDESSFVNLEMHYDDADAQGVEEDSLALYRFVDGEWEEVPGSSVDTDANVVSANVTEFPAENFVVAPLGQVDGDADGAQGDDEDDADEDEKGADADRDDDGDDRDENDRDENDRDDETRDEDDRTNGDGQGADGHKAPKPDDGANGADAEEGTEGEDGEDTDDAVFTDAITIEFAGIKITFGPPTDPDGDGVYDDVTGDGHVDVFDAIAHAGVVTAVNHGTVDLTSDQADALDVDRDGVVDYDDALALVDTN